MAVVGPVVDERLRYRLQAGLQGAVAGREIVRACRIRRQWILLLQKRLRVFAPQQRDSVALPVCGCGTGPEEAAGDRLVFVIHLVAVEFYEREVEVQRLHVGLAASGHEYRRCEVLGGVAGNDGREGVNVDASARQGSGQNSSCYSEDLLGFHIFYLFRPLR